jgi:hypothetical protein
MARLCAIFAVLAGCSSGGGSTTIDPCSHGCGFDLGSAPTTQPAVCMMYVSCATAAAPSQAAAILAAYGPSGTCWTTTPEVANDCLLACENGVKGLHPAEPTLCPLCQSDADCSAAKPACDSQKGECVECTRNQDCPSSTPVCRNQKCQPGCLDDNGCSSGRCDLTSNACVECLAAADCAGSSSGLGCNTTTHQCGCGALVAGLGGGCPTGQICSDAFSGFCCTPDCKNLQCGNANPGCGSDNAYACGTCSGNAVCNQGYCTTFGQACTPGGSDCSSGQACLFEKTSQKHLCRFSRGIGQSCSQSNNAGCNVSADSEDAFSCTSGMCDPYCAAAGDCPSGLSCHPFFAASISPTLPGICY